MCTSICNRVREACFRAILFGQSGQGYVPLYIGIVWCTLQMSVKGRVSMKYTQNGLWVMVSILTPFWAIFGPFPPVIETKIDLCLNDRFNIIGH